MVSLCSDTVVAKFLAKNAPFNREALTKISGLHLHGNVAETTIPFYDCVVRKQIALNGIVSQQKGDEEGRLVGQQE